MVIFVYLLFLDEYLVIDLNFYVSKSEDHIKTVILEIKTD